MTTGHGGGQAPGLRTSGGSAVRNIISVDVEEYFQGSQFQHLFGMEAWPSFESRLRLGTEKVLRLLDRAGVTGTFFILGWNAERHPGLVRDIQAAGHEVGVHGYSHRHVYEQSPEEFRSELLRTVDTVQDITGESVWGHRAASFTITDRSQWALDLLAEAGLRYDASVFPIKRRRYGIPDSPRGPYVIRDSGNGGRLWEFPASCVRLAGVNLPVAGGGYLRLCPYSLTRWAVARLNREGIPAVVYVHPWEVDPDQPPVRVEWRTRFTHYVGLRSTEDKLRRLMADFRFGPFSQLLLELERRRPAADNGQQSDENGAS